MSVRKSSLAFVIYVGLVFATFLLLLVGMLIWRYYVETSLRTSIDAIQESHNYTADFRIAHIAKLETSSITRFEPEEISHLPHLTIEDLDEQAELLKFLGTAKTGPKLRSRGGDLSTALLIINSRRYGRLVTYITFAIDIRSGKYYAYIYAIGEGHDSLIYGTAYESDDPKFLSFLRQIIPWFDEEATRYEKAISTSQFFNRLDGTQRPGGTVETRSFVCHWPPAHSFLHISASVEHRLGSVIIGGMYLRLPFVTIVYGFGINVC